MAKATRSMALVFGCGTLLAGLALAQQQVVPFGPGALSALKPGDGYLYSLRVLFHGPGSYGMDRTSSGYADPYETCSFRVVVTDALNREDAVQIKARVDRLPDARMKKGFDNLYWLIAGSRGDRGRVQVYTGLGDDGPGRAGLASRGGGMVDIPPVFYGYPELTSVPTQGEASFTVAAPDSSEPMRYRARYDAQQNHAVVSVEYLTYAYEEDAQRGRTIEYWVRDQRKLQPTVPMGQEAAPLLAWAAERPKDANDQPRFYNVVPVRIIETETQVWEPGAPFPKKITRRDVNGKLLFEATLVKVEQVALPPAEPEAAPAAPVIE